MSVLWQGDKRWRSELVGEGPGRIGKIGCVVTSFANLLRFWHLDDNATPVSVMTNAKAWAKMETERSGKKARAFIGDLVVWANVGAGNGLVVEDVVDERNGQARMREVIREALEADDPRACFLWVDKDSPATPDEDDRGKHWVAATFLLKGDKDDDDEVHYLDSATADEGAINLRTLSGVSMWGSEVKLYRVRAVRVVRPQP